MSTGEDLREARRVIAAAEKHVTELRQQLHNERQRTMLAEKRALAFEEACARAYRSSFVTRREPSEPGS
jgi:hypothetical protein